MLFSSNRRDYDVHNGKRLERQHQCLVCAEIFETMEELWAHEDLLHPEVGVDVVDDETIEEEEDDDEEDL